MPRKVPTFPSFAIWRRNRRLALNKMIEFYQMSKRRTAAYIVLQAMKNHVKQRKLNQRQNVDYSQPDGIKLEFPNFYETQNSRLSNDSVDAPLAREFSDSSYEPERECPSTPPTDWKKYKNNWNISNHTFRELDHSSDYEPSVSGESECSDSDATVDLEEIDFIQKDFEEKEMSFFLDIDDLPISCPWISLEDWKEKKKVIVID